LRKEKEAEKIFSGFHILLESETGFRMKIVVVVVVVV